MALRGFLASNPDFIRMLCKERPRPQKGEPESAHGYRLAQHFDTIEQIEEMASDALPTAQELES